MFRKLRTWYPGAKYHITSRGNRRLAIFYDGFDRSAYLELLEEARKFYPFYLHSYCLMTNHIHLLIETIQHHPKEMMKMLNSRYAMYFNKRHHLVGHVFQGRYGAELIEASDYLLDSSRYIHLNPARASMVKSPEVYPWSSYYAYVSDTPNPYITILLFFPEVHEDIAFHDFHFLQEEVVTDVTEGEKYRIDLLVETRLKGEDGLIVIHVESQAQYQSAFNQRMFVYFSRLYEKYRRKILPIAIFSHDAVRAEPNHFLMNFPFMQVLDFRYLPIQLKNVNFRGQSPGRLTPMSSYF